MSHDRDWEEERESVLKRLFDGAFGRSKRTKDEMDKDIHWLGTVQRRLRDEDDE
jgi:hypothetical protein